MTDASAGILLTTLVGVLWGGIGALNSSVARNRWSIPLYSATVSFFSCLILGATEVRWDVLLAGEGSRLLDLALVLVPASLANLLGMVAMTMAMGRGHNGFAWTVGQAAMVITFLASVVIWGDPAKWRQWIGVLLVLAALVLIGMGKAGDPKRNVGQGLSWLRMSFIAFALFGLSQTCYTIPSRWAGWTDSARLRPLLVALPVLLVTGVWAVLRRDRYSRGLVLLSIGGASIGVVSPILLFRALDLMGRTGMLAVTYPLAVGVCIISFALYSRTTLGERFGVSGVSAIALGVGGIVALAVV